MLLPLPDSSPRAFGLQAGSFPFGARARIAARVLGAACLLLGAFGCADGERPIPPSSTEQAAPPTEQAAPAALPKAAPPLEGADGEAAERVLLETERGEIEIEIYPTRAPQSAMNFLAYVEQGHYEGATLYRVTRRGVGGSSISVVQGGLLAETMAGDGSEYEEPDRPLPPIEHEPTTLTGIPNERGTIAYARLAPGTAGSEFFFNIEDNRVLDTGEGGPERDGFGYATFGRVLRGMDVLEAIQALPADGAAGIEMLRGQILREPVTIHSARWLVDDAE
ncbi:MAG: peptidylprolyl isomerase [Pseudomonadota bacterium]